MLLNRSPSWRQRGRPQAVDLPQDLSEQSSEDSDPRELGSISTAGCIPRSSRAGALLTVEQMYAADRDMACLAPYRWN